MAASGRAETALTEHLLNPMKCCLPSQSTGAGVWGAGMWFHLALFFDDHELGLAYTCVATATSLAGLLGAPLAAGLLLLDGVCGLRGWQWLFLARPRAFAQVL